ncbi:DUF732 domain-containing protein [Tsukamurella sp. PLM1]|uniref:DUF732 domain-containing protein n=1 Tax=Tsukamurella sp. PLM1 TaxID=2929795 RepID=UPI0020639F1F|nr:hypothetical protein MTP03_41160 [Tsukamurella sp. PLM1]
MSLLTPLRDASFRWVRIVAIAILLGGGTLGCGPTNAVSTNSTGGGDTQFNTEVAKVLEGYHTGGLTDDVKVELATARAAAREVCDTLRAGTSLIDISWSVAERNAGPALSRVNADHGADYAGRVVGIAVRAYCPEYLNK